MSHPHPQSNDGQIPLSDLSSGEKGQVCDLKGDAATCARLREMGFCEEAIVEHVSGKHTMLCQVCGSKIALNSRAAQHVLVKKLAS